MSTYTSPGSAAPRNGQGALFTLLGPSRVAAAVAPKKRRLSPILSTGAWVQAFVILQIGCQGALLLGGPNVVRLLARSAAFGLSLIFLVLLPGRGPRHPVVPLALCILGLLALEWFHPTTNSALAGMAQIALYLAILAPLFWVTRCRISPVTLRRVLLTIWLFQSCSAAVGVLQVYFPGRFQPKLAAVVAERGAGYVKSVKIKLSTGEQVLRPMGLSDLPGGAGPAGLVALVFGLGFFVADRRWGMRAVCLATMVIGLFCIYLSQLRVVLVMAGICVLVFGAALCWRGEYQRVMAIVVIVTAVIVGSFAWAVSIGGKVVTGRLATLTQNRPGEVYYSNRGRYVEQLVKELLPKYPLGAGLGRWGMMNRYFGDNSQASRADLWVEIQWTGWLFDGGLPLMILYPVAILVACWTAWRIALSRLPAELWLWGALILAYNIGALAVTFNYAYFISQSGMEFWLLNACLFGAASQVRRRASRRVVCPASMPA